VEVRHILVPPELKAKLEREVDAIQAAWGRRRRPLTRAEARGWLLAAALRLDQGRLAKSLVDAAG